MTHNILKTENYLLVVDDSEIKDGECYLSPSGIWFYNNLNPNHNKECKKIIAHLPLGSPILEGVPLLPPLENKDDVDKLAGNLLYGKYPYHPPQDSGYWKDMYKEGYNKAKETYKFTEEDVRKAIEMTRKEVKVPYDFNGNTLIDYCYYSDDEIIQSLSQPKIPVEFECETKTIWARNTDRNVPTKDDFDYEPKTTTNSQGQTEWVGKYIYEGGEL